MAMLGQPEQLSPREFETMNYEKEMYEKQAAFNLEMSKIETKWASWLRIPKWIILLPVYLLFGIAFICSMFTKKELPQEFWNFLK